MFERALALDPHSIEAQSLLARTLMSRVLDGVSASAAADIARAEELAGQALAASPRYALAHYARGGGLRAQNRYQEAIPEYETAIALDRNFVGALVGIAQCKVYAGSIDEAIPLVEQAIRISPRDPVIYWWYQQIGKVHLLQSRINEAILWLEKARSATPAHPGICAELASAYALNGEIERAVAELAEARRLSRDDRYSNLAQLRAARYWGVLEVRALFEATYFAGLRLAGMPEE